LSENGFFTKKF